MEHPFIHEDVYSIKTTNLVVVEKTYFDLSADEQRLLKNIMDSINEKLSYQQLHCVFSNENPDQLIQKYQSKKLLIFAEPSSTEVQTHVSGSKILYAGNLEELNANEAMKKQLWNGLKKLFTQ